MFQGKKAEVHHQSSLVLKVQPSRLASNHILKAKPTMFSDSTATITSTVMDRDAFRLYLTRRWFLVCWWFVQLFRVCEIFCLTFMVLSYELILANDMARIHTLDQLTFDISYSTLKILIWAFVVIDGMLCVTFGRSVYFSFRAHHLTFTSRKRSREYLTTSIESIQSIQTASRSLSPSRWVNPLVVAALVKKKWMEPAFYLHGVYFDHFFFARKGLEIMSQLYEGYQMSVLIADIRLNTVFVLIIVLNCLATPLTYWFVPKSNTPLRRLLVVVFSALLNCLSSSMIPALIFMPIATTSANRMRQILFYPGMYTTDEVAYTRMVREGQQLLVTSTLDFLATWIPHWSIFSCLWTCEDLLRRASSQIVVASSEPKNHTTQPVASHADRRQSRNTNCDSRLSTKSQRVVNSLLWFTAVATLAIHFASQRPRVIDGCKIASKPWFAFQSSCVVMNVNCYRHGIEGTADQLEQILAPINADSVFRLIFSHCPRLQMPVILRRFHRLGGLEIYNSTLHAWPAEASIRQADHPRLNYVFVLRTNLSILPEGLSDKQFPVGLDVVFFHETNLSSLPTDLHESWRSLWTLGLEHCQFESIPSTLSQMQLVSLSLTDNPLRKMHSVVSLNDTTQVIWLSNSPLQSLSIETTSSLDHLVQLELEYTQLVEIPLIVREWYLTKIRQNPDTSLAHSLFGSPYCDLVLPDDDQDQRYYQSLVCAKDHDSAGGVFAIEVIAAQREV